MTFGIGSETLCLAIFGNFFLGGTFFLGGENGVAGGGRGGFKHLIIVLSNSKKKKWDIFGISPQAEADALFFFAKKN